MIDHRRLNSLHNSESGRGSSIGVQAVAPSMKNANPAASTLDLRENRFIAIR
jgi:hypothetical protein